VVVEGVKRMEQNMEERPGYDGDKERETLWRQPIENCVAGHISHDGGPTHEPNDHTDSPNAVERTNHPPKKKPEGNPVENYTEGHEF